MKIGAVIICRFNSSRLPGKILKKINNKPLLSYIIERLNCINNIDQIIVATSNKDTDQPIVDFCTENDIKFYRGSLQNVAERFLKCSLHFDLDYSIRVNGDNLFLDPKVISNMILKMGDKKYDMISNVKGRTFPKGVSVEIVNVEFYNNLFSKLNKPIYQEHVTNYIYENLECGYFYHYINHTFPDAAGAQLAIDTKKDFEIAKRIIDSFEKNHTHYGFKEIFNRMTRFQRLQ